MALDIFIDALLYRNRSMASILKVDVLSNVVVLGLAFIIYVYFFNY